MYLFLMPEVGMKSDHHFQLFTLVHKFSAHLPCKKRISSSLQVSPHTVQFECMFSVGLNLCFSYCVTIPDHNQIEDAASRGQAVPG